MAKHFTFREREFLYRLKQAGKCHAEIGRPMGRRRTTIGRELKRNAGQRGYRSQQAQRLSDQRRLACRRPHKLADPDVHRYVQERLNTYWSPDQIGGRAQEQFPDEPRRHVSHPTIYAWIKSRPPDERRRYGDWEGDPIVGAPRSGVFVTLVERRPGDLAALKSCDRRARRVRRKIEQMLSPWPAELRRSATFDNGKEFAERQLLERNLRCKIYFAEPYKSWQRGLNEYTNRLLRQYFPKGTLLRLRVLAGTSTSSRATQQPATQAPRLPNPHGSAENSPARLRLRIDGAEQRKLLRMV